LKSSKTMTPEWIIEKFQLEPLPVEGGLFQRHYAAEELVPHHALPGRYTRPKLFGSAICYMHTAQTRSLLHRLKTDEIYHFYNGDPVVLVLLYPDGAHEVVTLGQDYAAGHMPFCVVPRGVWQGSCLVQGGTWALMGITLAPAYDEDDFELGERASLIAHFAAAREWIERLT
jgi:uncharacterized protein